MSKLDNALKRFEQIATNGFRGSDYIQVDDSRAWFGEDLSVVKTTLSKKDELLALYEEKNLLIEILYVGIGNEQINKYQMKGKSENYKRLEEILIRIETLKKEIEEMK